MLEAAFEDVELNDGRYQALLAEGRSLRAVARTLGTHHTVVARTVGPA